MKYLGFFLLVVGFAGGTAAQAVCESRADALTLNTVDGYQEVAMAVMGDATVEAVEQDLDITAEASTNTSANVRALPKRDAAVIVSLARGTVVTAIGRLEFADGEEWIQIALPDSDGSGWVYEPLLDNEGGYEGVLPFNPDTFKPYYIIPSAYHMAAGDAPCSGVIIQNMSGASFRIQLNQLYVEWVGTLYAGWEGEQMVVALLDGSGQAFAPNEATPTPLLPGASLVADVGGSGQVVAVDALAPLGTPTLGEGLEALPVAVTMPTPLSEETIERLTMPQYERIPANFSARYTCELREVQSPYWSADTGEVIGLTEFMGCNWDNRFLFQLSRTFPEMQYQLVSASEDGIVLSSNGDISTITLDPNTLKIRPGGYISSSEYSILVPLTFPVINVPQLHPNSPPPFSLIPQFVGGNVVYTGGYTQNMVSKYAIEVKHTYTFNAYSGLLTRLEYEERVTACYFCSAAISRRVPFYGVHSIWTLAGTTMPMQ